MNFNIKNFFQKYEGDDAGTEKAELPIPDPYTVERLSNIKFEDLDADLTLLSNNLKACTKRAEKVVKKSDKDHLQPFKDRMEEFFIKAKKDLDVETKSMKKCKKSFKAVMKYFQFTNKGGKEVTTYDFFCLWSPFCNDFMTIWQKEQLNIVKTRMKEAEEKARKLKEEKMDVAKKTKDGAGLKSKLKGKLKSAPSVEEES